MPSAEKDAPECPTCWGDGYIDHDLGRETCTSCWGSGVTKTDAGVGTGAGEGATGRDTGTAWVTRSKDCPEAPAQAHPRVIPPAERTTDE